MALSLMKIFVKTTRVGLLISTTLIFKPFTASSAVIQSPTIAIQSVAAGTDNSVTLQYTTNLSSSPNWQTLGEFSGSTNILFQNLPAVFVRGVCSNLMVSTTLTWPASTDTSVAGYKVYYGVVSGVYTNSLDVGDATTATISNLIAGTNYYFAATAYTASGAESPFSNQKSGAFQAGFSLGVSAMRAWGNTMRMTVTQIVTNAAIISLPMVITKKITAAINNPITLQFTTNLSSPAWQNLGTFYGSTNISFTNVPAVFIRGACSNLTSSATLAWQPSSDSTVVGYKLYYGTVSGVYTSVINVGKSTMATVSNLVSGITYYFAVTAYDSTSKESPFSNEASGAFHPTFSLTIGSP